MAKQERPIVYIVEPDISFRESLEALLDSAGYAVRAYPSYDRFLRRNWKSGVSWDSLELRLPDMSGEVLLHAISEHSGNAPLLVTVRRKSRMTGEFLRVSSAQRGSDSFPI